MGGGGGVIGGGWGTLAFSSERFNFSKLPVMHMVTKENIHWYQQSSELLKNKNISLGP